MIRFKIVTPDRILLEKEVESVTVPTQTGEITILQNHIPLVSNLKSGELRYKESGVDNFFAVSGGFIEVREGNQVIVLADTAEFVEEIDLDRAEQARQMALKLMQESYSDEKGSADALALLEKNLARLRVARKHRTHTRKNLESGIFNE
ncbi:MAG: ATP synthase F1 subunit epsilon [Candidatus Doudnabacteria bacterium]|nr:ATP synthase F1 subunit epsilon [Candidatus Doudnabacteria bacterium]